jgi:hypothetical protein
MAGRDTQQLFDRHSDFRSAGGGLGGMNSKRTDKFRNVVSGCVEVGGFGAARAQARLKRMIAIFQPFKPDRAR